MQTVLDHLSSGAYVLTPNNRLSATLLEDYFKQQGKIAVEKPPCVPYRTFLTHCYKQYVYNHADSKHPILLSDMQCQYLWKKILLAHQEITYSEGLLSAVMDAWNNCVLWQISPNNLSFSYTPQTQQFQYWWQLFNAQLLSMQAITEQQILPYLIQANFTFDYNQLVWVCFDSFTPQQIQLHHYLTEQGIVNTCYDLPEKISACYQYQAQHDEQEQQQLMQFLKQRLALGEKNIGVVVPDMQQQAQRLQRFLQQHLEPESFNISLGKTLKDYPLVAHALNWLSLEQSEISNHQAKLLLSSPYIADAQKEFQSRIQFLQDSPFMQKPAIQLKKWIEALTQSAPLLAKALDGITPYPAKTTPQNWVDLFKTRLEKLGFPGDYGLQSENFQCFNRFMDVFTVFSQLGLFTSTLQVNEALEILKNITAKTIFQPQTTPKPIQVLGLLEASGCQFDSVWVMGLTDQCLPQKTRLSPFIPHELQRDLAMPHSLPTRELPLAKHLLQRLQNSTNLGIFSFPALQADSPNLPSPLITQYPPYNPQVIINHQTTALITVEESYTIALTPEETITGGTAILANQAKCPFKAFALHRLHAKPAPEISEGLGARDRGQLIHHIMEDIWKELGSQKQLLSLNANDLDMRIEQSILTALTPYALPEFIQQIELPRLYRLVHACLDWEKQRPSFTVESLEQDYSIQLGKLDFKVRVDRIDRCENRKWVIDYKSNLPTSKPWNEERPKEPQLLLYALLDETINTLLFLELKAGKIAVAGFSEEKYNLAGITSPKKERTWFDERAYWQEQLHALADEFSHGICTPQPLDSSICAQCDFQNLCRFNQ